MKKIITLALAMVLCLSLCSCGDKSVTLTPDNVSDYLEFSANCKNGDYTNILGVLNVATADMEIKTYSISSGTFENVEVTIQVEMNDEDNSWSDNWHLADSEDEAIILTFKVSSDGTYQETYPIECQNSTIKLDGLRKVTVLSASGTFISK